MSTISVSGLSGTFEVDIDELPDGATVADLRTAAAIAGSLSIRRDGAAVSDHEPVQPGSYVTAPPAAKHG